jgi:hypothetical protein
MQAILIFLVVLLSLSRKIMSRYLTTNHDHSHSHHKWSFAVTDVTINSSIKSDLWTKTNPDCKLNCTCQQCLKFGLDPIKNCERMHAKCFGAGGDLAHIGICYHLFKATGRWGADSLTPRLSPPLLTAGTRFVPVRHTRVTARHKTHDRRAPSRRPWQHNPGVSMVHDW